MHQLPLGLELVAVGLKCQIFECAPRRPEILLPERHLGDVEARHPEAWIQIDGATELLGRFCKLLAPQKNGAAQVGVLGAIRSLLVRRVQFFERERKIARLVGRVRHLQHQIHARLSRRRQRGRVPRLFRRVRGHCLSRLALGSRVRRLRGKQGRQTREQACQKQKNETVTPAHRRPATKGA